MGFFEELKRRKVFRVAASYAVVAFIIMQLVEILFPMFDFPQWTQQFTVIIVLLGFPIAVILSWVFDKTPQGFVKTDVNETEELGGMTVKIDGRLFYKQKRNIFLVLGVVAGILIGTYGGGTFKKSVDKKSIAVLPFDNYSTDPEDQYFSDGITEVIIANLAKVKDLKVISRTSVMEYKNTTKKLKDIAEELGVAHILEGSIQRANGRVRVVGQLIDAYTDQHIWAETYDRKESDIFELQSDVAIQIAQAMKFELTTDEKDRISEKLTENTAAFEYYLKGIMFNSAGHSENNIRAGIKEFERATILDPNFAEAYAMLGKMYAHLKWYRHDLTGESLIKSKGAIDKAIKLKPNSPVARFSLGVYHYHGYRDYSKAMDEFLFASSMEPGNDNFIWYQGLIYRRLGDFGKSIELGLKAIELNPRSVLMLQNTAQSYTSIRNYNSAIDLYKNAISLSNKSKQTVWAYLRSLLFKTGDPVYLLEELESLGGSYPWVTFDLKYYNKDYLKALEYANKQKDIGTDGVRNYLPHDYKLGNIMVGLMDASKTDYHYRQAENNINEMLEKYPNDWRFYSTLGLIYARQGKNNKAVKYGLKAKEMLPLSKDALFGTYPEINLAKIYILIGQIDKGINQIELLSTLDGGLHYGQLKVDPIWDSIREDQRFINILNRLKPQA